MPKEKDLNNELEKLFKKKSTKEKIDNKSEKKLKKMLTSKPMTKAKLARLSKEKILKSTNVEDTQSMSLLTQSDLDSVLGNFLNEDKNSNEISLIDEIKEAILNSGRLSYREWKSLRGRVKEISEMLPHIEFIISLKQQKKNK